MTEKLYGNPKQMSLFEDMEQSLLEAIEMEYGKDYREKVEKELKIEPFNNKYLCQYTDDLVIPSEVSKTLWEFGKDPKKFIHTGINEIDTYISEINSQDNFIAEVNSLPMPESYPHEDDNFYIPEEYRNMSSEQLKNVKKAWDDYYKDREKMRRVMFGEGFTETFEDWGFTDEDIMEVERMIDMKEIKIKYFTDKIEKLKYIGGSKRSNWIDLRAAETIELKAGDFKLIPLGVAMKLPEGYEAHIAPRSSTFKTWGILQCNSVGVVDQGYCGNDDQWMMPVYATRDTVINVNDRVCQFRIIENQPEIEFIEVEYMEDESRGGFGSTGKQ